VTKILPLLKKYLPYILLGLGILVFAIVGVIVVKNKNKGVDDEEEVVVELPFDKRPVVSLTPSADGHWLKWKKSIRRLTCLITSFCTACRTDGLRECPGQ